jgi:predicted dehydrogenase
VFDYIATLVPRIGKFTYFVQQTAGDVQPTNKYAGTSWRKNPDYQGGFLLDGGVHFIAGLRKILPSPIAIVSAFTRLNRDYLPPADTVHATFQLADGATGIYGNTSAASRFVYDVELMGQEGYILASVAYFGESKVELVLKDGTKESQEFKDANKNAIAEEFRVFAEAISHNREDPNGSPEEALADLAIVESMLTSGDKGGEPIKVKYA